MPMLSIIVGVDLYKDLEVPDGCTVSKWKDLLGQGFLGDKILYSGKLTCQKDTGRETLENAALLPEPPERIFVGGPGSVVKMLELALKKKLGAPVMRVDSAREFRKDLLASSTRNAKGVVPPAQSGSQAMSEPVPPDYPPVERRPSLPSEVFRKPVQAAGAQERAISSPQQNTLALGQRGQETHKSSGSDDLVRYWRAGMQGMRPYMEDRTCAFLKLPGYEDVALFGTFDGHGGDEVSELTVTTFPGVLAGMLNSGLGPRAALLEAFRSWDEDLRRMHNHTSPHPYDRTGSTAVVILLLREERRMFCANCGDSRAVLGVGSGVTRAVGLSEDHKPQDHDERSRIEGAGGRVELFGPCWRIDKGLNVSRSLGDFAYKNNHNLPADRQKVTAVPDILERDIDEDFQFVIMGSDGVFDVHSSEALVRHVQKSRIYGLSGEKAVEVALSQSLPSGDNVSICMFEVARPDGTWPSYS